MRVRRLARRAAMSWPVIAATVLLAGGVLIFGILGRPSPGTTSDTFWNSLWVNGTFQTYRDAGLAVDASDVVVVGRFASVDKGRTANAAPELGPDGLLSFAKVRVKVEVVLAGSYTPNADGTLGLELFLPEASALEVMVANTPGERTLLFLRASPSGGNDAYALLNPEALVRDLPGSQTVSWAEEPWLLALGRLPFDSVVDSVRAES